MSLKSVNLDLMNVEGYKKIQAGRKIRSFVIWHLKTKVLP